MSNVGERVRALRKRKGWTQGELAERIEASVQLVSFIERGERQWTQATLNKMAEVFSVSPGLLIDPSVDLDRLVEISEILSGLSHLDNSGVEAVRHMIASLRSLR